MSGSDEAADVAAKGASTASDALTTYATVAAAKNAAVPSGVAVLRTIGYFKEGDGGGAWYRRRSDEPAHDLGFKDKSGAYWELDPSDGIWNARQCGAVGDGHANDTVALQSALDFAYYVAGTSSPDTIKVSPPKRRPKLLIPAGNYLHNGLVIKDLQPRKPDEHPSWNAGYITIEGDGPFTTALVCTSPENWSLYIQSGVVTIRSLHITSDGVHRSKTSGTGHGIFAQPGIPPANITRVVLEDLTIDQQPLDGINLDQIEQFEINRVFSSDNGGNGFVETFQKSAKGIGITVGCLVRSCRFANNGKAGLDVELHNSTFINVETLTNAGPVQFNIRGDRNTLINPDVEFKKPDAKTEDSETEASEAQQAGQTGLVLGGDHNTIIGGIFNNMDVTAIQVYGNSATIINPGVAPTAKGVGITLKTGTTGHLVRVCLSKEKTAGPMFSPADPDPGSTYSYVTPDGRGYVLQGTLRSYPGIGNKVVPVDKGELSFEATHDDTITIRLLGDDGVHRSAKLTLSQDTPD